MEHKSPAKRVRLIPFILLVLYLSVAVSAVDIEPVKCVCECDGVSIQAAGSTLRGGLLGIPDEERMASLSQCSYSCGAVCGGSTRVASGSDCFGDCRDHYCRDSDVMDCSSTPVESSCISGCEVACNKACRTNTSTYSIISTLQYLLFAIAAIIFAICGLRFITSDNPESRDETKKCILAIIMIFVLIGVAKPLVYAFYAIGGIGSITISPEFSDETMRIGNAVVSCWDSSTGGLDMVCELIDVIGWPSGSRVTEDKVEAYLQSIERGDVEGKMDWKIGVDITPHIVQDVCLKYDTSWGNEVFVMKQSQDALCGYFVDGPIGDESCKEVCKQYAGFTWKEDDDNTCFHNGHCYCERTSFGACQSSQNKPCIEQCSTRVFDQCAADGGPGCSMLCLRAVNTASGGLLGCLAGGTSTLSTTDFSDEEKQIGDAAIECWDDNEVIGEDKACELIDVIGWPSGSRVIADRVEAYLQSIGRGDVGGKMDWKIDTDLPGDAIDNTLGEPVCIKYDTFMGDEVFVLKQSQDELCEAEPECRPLIDNGDHSDKIDIVFVLAHTATWEMFENEIREMFNALTAKDPISANAGKFNVYYYTGPGEVRADADNLCEGEKPPGYSSECSFADTTAFIHQEDCRDATDIIAGGFPMPGSEFTARYSSTMVHESGHAIFGMEDAYYEAGRTYIQLPQLPNVWSSQANCEADRDPAWSEPCVEICDPSGENCVGFWKLDYDCIMGHHVMGYYGSFCPACRRRISWVLSQYE